MVVRNSWQMFHQTWIIQLLRIRYRTLLSAIGVIDDYRSSSILRPARSEAEDGILSLSPCRRNGHILTSMNVSTLREIGKLSTKERWVLIDDLWDSIEAEQALPPPGCLAQ